MSWAWQLESNDTAIHNIMKEEKNKNKPWPFITSKLNYSKKKRSLTWNIQVLFLPLQSQAVGNFSFSERTLAFNIFRRERYIIKIPRGEKRKKKKKSLKRLSLQPEFIHISRRWCMCVSASVRLQQCEKSESTQAHDKASWQWSPLKRIYSNRIGPEEGTFQRHLSHFLSSNFLEVPQG